MATTKINGQTQITDASIPSGKVDSSVIIAAGTHPFTGDQSLGGHKLTNLGAPSSANDAATKTYVDTVANGKDWKESCRAASTANVNVSSAPSSIDGVTLSSGDRILLKNQTTGSQNGIYVFNGSGSALTRSTDAAVLTSGTTCFVTEGSSSAGSEYLLATADPITVGTTPLSWTQSNASTVYTGSGGISVSGSVISPTYGTSASTICQGNDSRLSDARTPVGTALTSARIWVGSTSNVAVAVVMSGNGTLSDTGVLTVTGFLPLPGGSVAALQTPRRNAGNTAYEFATPGWLDTAQTWAAQQVVRSPANTVSLIARSSDGNTNQIFQVLASGGGTLFEIYENGALSASNYTSNGGYFGLNYLGLCLYSGNGVSWPSVNGLASTLAIGYVSAGILSLNDANASNDPALAFQAKSSTTNLRDRFRLATAAVDNTDATRKYRTVCTVYDTSAREAWRVEADGTNALMAVGGGTVTTGVALTVQAPTSGTAAAFKAAATTPGNIAEFQSSGGTALVSVQSGVDPYIVISANGTGGGASSGFYLTTNNALYPSTGWWLIRQTSNLFQFITAGGDGSGHQAMSILPNNNANIGLGPTTADTGIQVLVSAATSAMVGHVVRGAASRTAPLLQLQTSAGGLLGNVGGTIFTDFADGASTHTDGTFDDLYTHTTVANTFANNGDTLRGRVGLTLVGSATATRQIKLVFAGNTIFDTTALVSATGSNVVIDYTLVRVSATVVRYGVTIFSPGLASVVPPAVGELTSLTLTGTNILKVTGAAASTGAASSDITAKVQWIDRGEAA